MLLSLLACYILWLKMLENKVFDDINKISPIDPKKTTIPTIEEEEEEREARRRTNTHSGNWLKKMFKKR